MKYEKKTSLATGATVMVVSLFITKLMGALYNIPLSRLMSNQAMGIYSSAYALYAILLTLSTAGFPIAMGKTIAEELSLGEDNTVERLYRNTLKTVAILAFLFFIVMWQGAPEYSHLIALSDGKMASNDLTNSLRALSLSLLVVPFVSVYRGYLQGYQRMEYSGLSQTVEQFFRIAFLLSGVALAVHWGKSVSTQAAIATFGSVVGAVASFIVLEIGIYPLRFENSKKYRYKKGNKKEERKLQKKLLSYALPISLGTLIVPIAGFIDAVTIQNVLIFHGITLNNAMGQYGILARKALPLIQLPLTFAVAIGSTVLPALSYDQARSDRGGIERKISATLRSMLFVSFPAAGSFLILAKPLDLILYGSTVGEKIIASVAFMGIFSAMEMISTYILQGLGVMYTPVKNMGIGLLIKLGLNLVLVYFWGIIGAAIASTIAYFISSTLNFYSVKRKACLSFSLWKIYHPFVTTMVVFLSASWGIRFGVERILGSSLSVTWCSLVQILSVLLIGGGIYIVLVLGLKIVRIEELEKIPYIGTRVGNLLKKRSVHSPKNF